MQSDLGILTREKADYHIDRKTNRVTHRIARIVSYILEFFKRFRSDYAILDFIFKIENIQLIEYEEPLPEFDWYRTVSYASPPSSPRANARK